MPKDTPGEGMPMSSPGEQAPRTETSQQDFGTIESFHSELTLQPWKHRADTARWLAYGLIILLAFSFILHFTATFILVYCGKLEPAAFKDVLNLWLPVLSGLASAAATYYFTKDK